MVEANLSFVAGKFGRLLEGEVVFLKSSLYSVCKHLAVLFPIGGADIRQTSRPNSTDEDRNHRTQQRSERISWVAEKERSLRSRAGGVMPAE